MVIMLNYRYNVTVIIYDFGMITGVASSLILLLNSSDFQKE